MDEITARDFIDYQRYFQKNPQPSLVTEVMLAQVCAMIAGVAGTKNPKIRDYMLVTGKKKKKMTPEHMFVLMQGLAATTNANGNAMNPTKAPGGPND